MLGGGHLRRSGDCRHRHGAAHCGCPLADGHCGRPTAVRGLGVVVLGGVLGRIKDKRAAKAALVLLVGVSLKDLAKPSKTNGLQAAGKVLYPIYRKFCLFIAECSYYSS